MSTKPDLDRLVQLQKLALQFRAIKRNIHLPPSTDEFENDIEHSYSLALLAWFLAGHFPELDRDKVIRYALIHDLVEIHAGDTYVYGSATAKADKQDREAAALQQLAKEWPDFPELVATIEDYETRSSNESKFIYALDKLQPALIEYINEGRGWHHLGITFEKFCAEKNKKIPISPEVNQYSQALMQRLEQLPHLFPAS